MSYYDHVNAHDFYIVEGYTVTGLKAVEGYNPLNPNPVQYQKTERVFIKREVADDFAAQLEEQLQEWVRLYYKGKVRECPIIELFINQELTSGSNIVGQTIIKSYFLPQIKVVKKGTATYRQYACRESGWGDQLPGLSYVKWEDPSKIPLEKQDAE